MEGAHRMNVGILGGGISGITLQRFLRHPSVVIERDARIGGLCQTFWKNGFGYDIGGHILFSKHDHVTETVNRALGENVNQCRRLNTIFFKGRYVKYPFENDLAALDPEDRYECLMEYLRMAMAPPPDVPAANLEEWAYRTFGRGIADKYLIPYNRKIWKLEPRDTTTEWVARIPKPPLEDVVKSSLGISTEGYTHQLYFRYPLHGGFASVVDALRTPDGVVRCGAGVERVERRGRGWRVMAGGESHDFDRLVVTFPVHEAVKVFEGVPDAVHAAVGRLRYNAMRVVLVAVSNPSLLDKSAVYIPDESVLPHRVCYMGFFSPNMVRPGTSSLVAEVTMPPGHAIDQMDDAVMVERVVDDLDRIGIICRSEVIETDIRRIPYGYPVSDFAFTPSKQIVHDWFASQGVSLLGRFAEFDYINSDECMHRAMALAERLNREDGASL